MLKVYHFDSSSLSDDARRELMMPTSDEDLRNRAARPFADGCYAVVAEIEGGRGDLEKAWRKTQNLDDSWSLTPMDGCKPIWPDGDRRFGMRSSMLGDIVEVIEDDGLLSRFVVVAVGFRALPVVAA